MIVSCLLKKKMSEYKPGDSPCAGGWYRGLLEHGFQHCKDRMPPWIKDGVRWEEYCRDCCLIALVVLIGE